MFYINDILCPINIHYFFDGNWPTLLKWYITDYLYSGEKPLSHIEFIKEVCSQINIVNPQLSETTLKEQAYCFVDIISEMELSWRNYNSVISSWVGLVENWPEIVENHWRDRIETYYFPKSNERFTITRILTYLLGELDPEMQLVFLNICNYGWEHDNLVFLDYRLEKGPFSNLAKCVFFWIEGSKESYQKILEYTFPLLYKIRKQTLPFLKLAPEIRIGSTFKSCKWVEEKMSSNVF